MALDPMTSARINEWFQNYVNTASEFAAPKPPMTTDAQPTGLLNSASVGGDLSSARSAPQPGTTGLPTSRGVSAISSAAGIMPIGSGGVLMRSGAR